MHNRPPLFLRIAFCVVGFAFVAIGAFFDAWFIVPFGILSLIAGGLETRTIAHPDKRRLAAVTYSWGLKLFTRNFNIEQGSSLVGILYPAGSQCGDGISLHDSASLFLESPTGRKSLLANSLNAETLFRDGKALAQSLNINYKNKEEAS